MTSRLKRCHEISLCHHCLGGGHNDNICPGLKNNLQFPCYICKSKQHASSLCPEYKTNRSNVIASSLQDGHLLPVCLIKIGFNHSFVSIPRLLDTGSQISFISRQALTPLKIHYDTPIFQNILVSVNGQSQCKGHHVNLEFVLPNGQSKSLTILFRIISICLFLTRRYRLV